MPTLILFLNFHKVNFHKTNRYLKKNKLVRSEKSHTTQTRIWHAIISSVTDLVSLTNPFTRSLRREKVWSNCIDWYSSSTIYLLACYVGVAMTSGYGVTYARAILFLLNTQNKFMY